jgi:hypothetical protein
MRQNHLRDQRGVAMLLELVLVAAVLALAGLAVYQANHRAEVANVQNNAPAADSPEGLATSAAAIVVEDSDSDAIVSTEAEAAATEAEAAQTDVTNLGGSADGSF